MKEGQRDSGHGGNDDDHSPKPVDTFKRNFSLRGVLDEPAADEENYCEMTDALKVLPPRVSFFFLFLTYD